jgi:hypothetical protein
MEKKKKTKKPAELSKKLEEISVKKAKPAVEPKLFSLSDYCRLHIVGYKEHWFRSIERHAATQGAKCEALTEDECKNILSSWGAILK